MQYLFCPETMGFYPGELTGDAVGRPFVELTEDEYRALAGHALVVGDDGRPMLASAVPPSADQLMQAERAWRTGELNRTEWVVARHRDELDMAAATSLTAAQYAELLTWRQALREWPESAAFPASSKRPVPPIWLPYLTQ